MVNGYIIYFDIAALVMFSIHWLVYLLFDQFPSKRNRLYLGVLGCGTIAVIFDIFTVFGYGETTLPLAYNYGLNIVFLAFFNAVPCLYLLYLCETISSEKFGWLHRLAWTVYLVELILILTTPMHSLIFYFDEGMNYHHGSLFVLVYGMSLVYLFVALVVTVRYRKIMNYQQIFMVLAYTILNIMVVIIQRTFPHLLLSEFAVSVAIYFIYLTLQNPMSYIDKATGLMNSEAFYIRIKENLKREHPFRVIGVYVAGTGIIREKMGGAAQRQIIYDFSQYLKARMPGRMWCSAGEWNVVIVPDDEELCLALNKTIRSWHDTDYSLSGVSIATRIKTCCFTAGMDFKDEVELGNLMTYWRRYASDFEQMLMGSESFKYKMEHNQLLKDAVDRAIREESFEVYYQPIYNWKLDAYTHAEALARLHDEVLGDIRPDEFIAYGERSGQIVRIGEIIYGKVCDMIAREHLSDYGITCVHVNLSLLQCAQHNMAERYIKIMDDYGIPHQMISFEITETQSSEMTEDIHNNIEQFRNADISIAMDDYGTGYTNLMSVSRFAYHIVKIDKSLVWNAHEDKVVDVLLQNSIDSFKKIGQVIVAEGVETEEQIAMLKAYECDLFQGYYYSKPLPENDYIAFIQEKSKKTHARA